MLDRIEKKIGRYAIKNLIYYVLGGYVIGYILLLMNSRIEIYQYITLEPALVMKGQVWRLFTWVCTAPQNFSFFIIFMFLLYLYIGKSLEQNLGAFKYNLYMFSGWFFTTLGAMVMYWITSAVNGPMGAISMNVSTYYLNLASFLAFAVLFPDVRVYFFGILPIKIKVLAIIDVAYLGLSIVTNIIALIGLPNAMVQGALAQLGFSTALARLQIVTDIFSILISLLNFIIFFLTTRNFRRFSPKEIRRRKEFQKNVKEGQNQNPNAAGLAAVLREVQKSDEEEQTEEPVIEEQTEEQPRHFGPYVGSSRNGRSGYDDDDDEFFEEEEAPKKKFGYGSHAAGYSQATQRRTQEPEKVTRYSNAGQGLLHTCSICGRTSITNPELTFRYCSKCEGNHEYCEEHLFTHVHVK